jgi:hypothetical protein
VEAVRTHATFQSTWSAAAGSLSGARKDRRRAPPQELREDGEYRGVIDRSYYLEDIVDASRYVEAQQKTATSS